MSLCNTKVAAANILLIIVSFIWYFYSMALNRITILIGVAAEGLCLSLCNTMLITKLQETASKEYTARVTSIRDLFSNFAKLAGIGVTFFQLIFFEFNFIFITSASILFVYAIFKSQHQGFTKKNRSLNFSNLLNSMFFHFNFPHIFSGRYFYDE